MWYNEISRMMVWKRLMAVVLGCETPLACSTSVFISECSPSPVHLHGNRHSSLSNRQADRIQHKKWKLKSLQNNPIVKTRAWQPNPQSAPAVPPSPLLPLLITRHLRKDEEFTMLKEESKSSAKPLYTQLLQGAGLNKHTQPGAVFQLAWTQGNGTWACSTPPSFHPHELPFISSSQEHLCREGNDAGRGFLTREGVKGLLMGRQWGQERPCRAHIASVLGEPSFHAPTRFPAQFPLV